MLNYKFLANKIGLLLFFEAGFMLTAALVSVIYGENDLSAILTSAVITSGIGALLWLFSKGRSPEMGKREGYFLVAVVWAVYTIFGALPFWLSGYIPSYTDAFFEAISGFTTTGATILTNVEALPHGLLFWRSLTHFIGGVGILVLMIAVLPIYGTGNMMLYQAEYSGANFGSKIKPRVLDTVRRIVRIYLILNGVLFLFLLIAGMNPFDAICHTFGTMATGGFSTRNASIAAYSPLIQYIIMAFLFIAGINFTLLYFAGHGKFRKVWKDDEFRWYFSIVVIAGLIIMSDLFFVYKFPLEGAFRHGFFQAISFMTCTGFVSENYAIWSSFSILILLLVMAMGGSAGSTSGGIKVVRIVLLWRMIPVELKKIVHQRGIIPVRLNESSVKEDLLHRVLAFIMLFIIILLVAIFLLLLMGVDPKAAVFGSVSCMSNVGPGLGSVYANFSSVPMLGKWIFSTLMFVGRLEIFTLFILFTSAFWRQR